MYVFLNKLLKMTHIPCIVFLPERKDNRIKLLRGIFGSDVNLEILKSFCVAGGVKQRVYQQTLIESLTYSNKTVISHLSELVGLGILCEGMQKDGAWKKYFEVEENMQWIILLLHDPKSICDEKLKDSIKEFARLYLAHLDSLMERYGIDPGEVLT